MQFFTIFQFNIYFTLHVLFFCLISGPKTFFNLAKVQIGTGHLIFNHCPIIVRT
jgi:hypothetical protein